jgi:hypothetical protein
MLMLMVVFVLIFSLNKISFFLSFRFVAILALQNNTTGLEAAMIYYPRCTTIPQVLPQPQNSKRQGDFETKSQLTNQNFHHLPKIRSSEYYGLERSVQLLSATRSDITMRGYLLRMVSSSRSCCTGCK